MSSELLNSIRERMLKPPMMRPGLGALLVAAVVAAAPGVTQSVNSLDVGAKRFYTADGMTRVDVFVGIPFDGLESLMQPDDPGAIYRIAVEVLDDAGTVLTSSDWTGSVPDQFLHVERLSTVEHLAFAVPEGRFEIRVELTDSASGNVRRGGDTVLGFASRPFLSDLMLTNAMRMSVGTDDSPAPGEIQKGSIFLSASPRPTLSPRNATLYYYVECYPETETSVVTIARVLDADGRELIAAPAETVLLGADGGVVARAVDLAGLMPGEYSLEIETRYPDHTVRRSASFEMTGLEDEVARARASEMLIASHSPFEDLTEMGLDTLYAPLVTIMDAAERNLYDDLSVQGKRRYLDAFWQRRDPTSATPENVARDRFYSAVAEASRRYGEGGAGAIPGWRTDRGRIFLKYGQPDEWLERPQQGLTEPYEVWKFTRGRPLKFVFYDETGFGHYVLIFTDDRSETGRPDWEALLGTAAVEDVIAF